MVKKCLKKLIGSERLSFTELPTVLYEIENVLNNRPVCFMYDDDVSEVLTPNSLLYDRKLEFENKCVDEGYFELAEENELWLRSFWLMWYREYLDGLREIRSCRKAGQGASKIRVGDVVVIKEDGVPRHRWRLGEVVELLEGSNGFVRGAKVKAGKTKNIIRRPINRLYPTEVRWSNPREQNLSHAKDTINDKINIQDNSKRTIRPRRGAAVAGELHRRLNDTDAEP